MRTIKCPNCQAELPIDGIPPGTRVQCAGCENKFYIPEAVAVFETPENKYKSIILAVVVVVGFILIIVAATCGNKIVANIYEFFDGSIAEQQRIEKINKRVREIENFQRELDDWEKNITSGFKNH